MSIASELLYSTNKKHIVVGPKSSSAACSRNWPGLTELVYGLISSHEPNFRVESTLRSDLRIIGLSGLINQNSYTDTPDAYQKAALVVDELCRVLR
jgi:hypothetical protein